MRRGEKFRPHSPSYRRGVKMNPKDSSDDPGLSSIEARERAASRKARKSAEMAAVRTRDTAPELAVRSVLHRAGFRFRLHDRRLPGTPDIVLRRHRLVIFVHGCFWHGHQDCRRATLPSTRAEFWRAKVARNIERDADAVERLHRSGWRTLTLWGCRLTDGQAIADLLGEALDMRGRPVPELRSQIRASRRSSR